MHNLTPVSKEFIEKEYWENNKTIREIAQETNHCASYIYYRMESFGIQRRPTMTEETKKKLSIAKKGKPSQMRGVKPSEEARRKMSEAKKGYIENQQNMVDTQRKERMDILRYLFLIILMQQKMGMLWNTSW